MGITGGMKKLKADLKNMTWKQRWEHLWTYYRWVIIVAVMAVMIISVIRGLCAIPEDSKTSPD